MSGLNKNIFLISNSVAANAQQKTVERYSYHTIMNPFLSAFIIPAIVIHYKYFLPYQFSLNSFYPLNSENLDSQNRRFLIPHKGNYY